VVRARGALGDVDVIHEHLLDITQGVPYIIIVTHSRIHVVTKLAIQDSVGDQIGEDVDSNHDGSRECDEHLSVERVRVSVDIEQSTLYFVKSSPFIAFGLNSSEAEEC
jgi:hypothetical protein